MSEGAAGSWMSSESKRAYTGERDTTGLYGCSCSPAVLIVIVLNYGGWANAIIPN